MNCIRALFVLLFAALLSAQAFSLESIPKPIKNITVIGTVFCDACSNDTFSKNSYFLQGAKVQVDCKLRSNMKPSGEISIRVDRITDQYGVYKLDIPPVDGFDCTEGREIDSFCQATLIASSSPSCDVPGIKSSTEHVAVKNREINACLYNLNALSYKPARKDSNLCGTTTKEQMDSTLDSSLFFWPPFPPFGFPCPIWPPFPYPFPPLFPSPPSLPFPPLFPSPPSLPFPFPPIPFFTPPPAFPFPLPPMWPTPNPPPSFPFPTFPPLPPIPSLFPPPPPPPSFPFPPLPPLLPLPLPPVLPLPPFTPIPSLFPPPPPPPSPPPPTFPFLPPLPPLFPTPGLPQPPPPSPPAFSWKDPRTWFPSPPPSSFPRPPT